MNYIVVIDELVVVMHGYPKLPVHLHKDKEIRLIISLLPVEKCDFDYCFMYSKVFATWGLCEYACVLKP